ncbi:MAG: hypothetical protein Ct9H90mP16_14590 [Candidatus Poseidoniales archaeon]|nr:MAG: hypothetical protein Ct9H90mP16_14590 [Candidatus Poseidoniales archaeon]
MSLEDPNYPWRDSRLPPKGGVVNSHPGLLPDVEVASPAWSVYHDIPIGSTTHFCDNGNDTGELLLRREIPVKRGMT